MEAHARPVVAAVLGEVTVDAQVDAEGIIEPASLAGEAGYEVPEPGPDAHTGDVAAAAMVDAVAACDVRADANARDAQVAARPVGRAVGEAQAMALLLGPRQAQARVAGLRRRRRREGPGIVGHSAEGLGVYWRAAAYIDRPELVVSGNADQVLIAIA